MNPKTATVAAVQMHSELGDVAGNADRLERLIHQAADGGAKVIATPECGVPGYASADLRTIWHLPGTPIDPWFTPRDVREVAEPIPGPTTRRFAELARERGVWLQIGLIERAGDRCYNAAALLSPAGEPAAVHRKRWLWPAVDPAWATPGDVSPVRVSTPFGSIGIAVCYDIHRVRRLYSAGELWTLLFPSAWVDTEPPTKYFDRRFPQVARSLNCNVVFANACVPKGEVRFFGTGQSSIYRPDGSVAARSGERFENDVVLGVVSTKI
jgi:predicted amidohydrolase